MNVLKKLNYYCNEKENQFFDRKSAKIKPIDTLRHLVAFANALGGSLVIGIEDNGIVTGFKYKGAHSIDEYRNIFLTELRETPLNPQFVILDVINNKGIKDNVLVISVDVSADRVIKSHNGKVYLRQDDKSVELNFEQILQLQYDRGQRYFEDEVIQTSCLDDIDERLVEDYRKIMC